MSYRAGMPRSGALLLVFPLLLASTVDCGSSLSGGPYNPPTPAPPTTTAARVNSPDSAVSTGDPLASIRSRGALHGEPIRISAAAGRPERWVVFLGSPEVARAAWVVTPGATSRDAIPTNDWPEGVKVIGHAMRGHTVYVLVETLATLDQPAGIRSVWTIDANYATAGTLDDDWRFVGVKEVEDIKKRLTMPPPSANLKHEDMIASLTAAGASMGALAKSFPEAGADVYQVWQNALMQHMEHLDAKTLAKSTRAKKLIAMVRAAAAQERCESSVCWALGEHGESIGGVAMAQDGGSVVIQGFVEHAVPPPATAGGTPQAAAASPSSAATEQSLREQVLDKPRQMLGEAPLGKDGTIGVAMSADADKHLLVVVHDGNFTRVYHDMSTVRGALTPRDVRFADVDGDGRTDVIVRTSGHWDNGVTNVTYTRALLAPRSVQTTELQGDVAAELAMQGTATIDDAVKAALLVPTHGIKQADACRILAGANTVTGFQRVATQDARVFTFDQPASPFLHGTVKNVSSLRPDDVRDAGRHCRQMACDPARPVCTYTESGTYGEYYLFAWPDGAPRVTGAAFYNGP